LLMTRRSSHRGRALTRRGPAGRQGRPALGGAVRAADRGAGAAGARAGRRARGRRPRQHAAHAGRARRLARAPVRPPLDTVLAMCAVLSVGYIRVGVQTSHAEYTACARGREAVRVLVEAGADTRARNVDGRTAAELAGQPAAAGLLAQEEAWLAAESAPRSCYVLFAGARARPRSGVQTQRNGASTLDGVIKKYVHGGCCFSARWPVACSEGNTLGVYRSQVSLRWVARNRLSARARQAPERGRGAAPPGATLTWRWAL